MPHPQQQHPKGGGSWSGGQQKNQPPQPKPPAPILFEPNKDGQIHSTLLTDQVKKWMDYVPRGKNKGQLNSHQLRRFYGEFKRIEQKIRQDAGNFDKYRPLVAMIKARAAYAVNPKNPRIPKEFREFLDDLVTQALKDEEHFKAAALAFEAFVGYCYGEGMEE
ncbi:MAG: type III-A CRISPR-associated protein Csm2 [Candidatus Sumerlaeaceae bacterium]|nr:type III-A CRISPR-associated protein Csm2 [Candidatus Sumerlaeaceae bacterium]